MAACKPGKTHRFTVTLSVAGWKECWHGCGAQQKVADMSYWAGRAGTKEGKRRR